MQLVKPRSIVLYGLGLNTDLESEHAAELAGSEAKRVHINDLIEKNDSLSNYQLLIMPGGFADGDVLGAGKIFAYRIKHGLSDQIQRFIEDDKLIFGACNGFQIMVKAGLLPGFDRNYKEQLVTLTNNDSGRFEDRWVYLKANKESPCIFTKDIQRLYMGVRHGEGKFVTLNEDVYERLKRNNHVVVCYTDMIGNMNPPYPWNPNGSVDGIAGICDETGRIFGLMPHPEAFIHKTNHPRWTRKDEDADKMLSYNKIFENAINYFK
ncbi:MAG: phosphoribosylformylglycinamidine synthase subunit PurQ [Candidatus Aenigmarchaeota archaeon]|nr:phosphoribosylformylglycinamidine synthase subunit PurQ [Candidatus Aenigmarchaeota archaeon]